MTQYIDTLKARAQTATDTNDTTALAELTAELIDQLEQVEEVFKAHATAAPGLANENIRLRAELKARENL